MMNSKNDMTQVEFSPTFNSGNDSIGVPIDRINQNSISSTSDENSSIGFTPINNFENDVLGINSVDNSQSNN